MPRPAHWTFVFLISCGALVSACDSGTEEAAELDVEVAASTDAPQAGELVTLTGSVAGASGGTLTYAWTFGSRPAGSTAALSNPSSRITTFVPDEAGRYVVSLEVSDGEVSGSDNAVFTIEEAPPVELAEDILVDTTLRERRYTVPEGVVISVADGAQLSIAPGVRIEFETNAGLRVRPGAALTAMGTAEEPIVLRRAGTEGYWTGVLILSNDERNELTHVEVIYGGANAPDLTFAPGNVMVGRGARLTLRNSTIRGSRNYGLVVEPRSMLPGFASNTFIGNSQAGVRISPSVVGALDEASSYTNNGLGLQSYVELDDQGVTTDSITTDTRLRRLDVPYLVPSLEVFSVVGGLLTIDPGVQIEFARLAGFEIGPNAALSAIGTAAAPVVLAPTSGLNAPGDWRGLVIRSDDQRNALTHAEVAFGGGGLSYTNVSSSANIVLDDGAHLALVNSVVTFSKTWGVWLEPGANLIEEGTTYSDNESGDVGGN